MHSISQHECNENAQNKKSVKAFQATKEQPSRTVVHAKLEMTTPDSPEEVEADAAANDIVQGGKISRSIFAGSAGGGISVSSQMEGRLNSMQGGGQVMPDGLRNMMERGFNRDFSQVRLHTDSEAASLSSSIHAKAFTHGNDIYFNQGQFSPNTSEGQKLMAHELTHVVQGSGKVGRELDFSGKPMNEYYKRSDGSLAELPVLQTVSVDLYKYMSMNVEGEVTDYEAIIRKDMDKTLEVVNYCIEYLENMDDKNADVFNDYFNMPSRTKYVLEIYRKIKNVIEKRRIYFSISLIDKKYAFVYQNDGRYAIALTNSYFQQSDSERVNTLVHELAHEVDNNIIDVAYGIDNVRGLSGTESAIANASNYGFFAESFLSQKEFNEKILDEMFHTNNWDLKLNSQKLFNLSPFLFHDFKDTPIDKDPSLISPPVEPSDTSVKIPEFNWLIYPGFDPMSLKFWFKF